MPSSNAIHRDKALENISVAYRPEGFIADIVAPIVKVQHESDVYYVYSRGNNSLPETIRANGAETNRATFDVSTSSYRLDAHGLHDDVTDRDRSNADKALNLDIAATEAITNRMLIRREVDLATIVQTAANWSNNASLTSALAWTANTTLSNPITQIDSASSVILLNSGKKPNLLVINNATFIGAKEHVSITDRVKYTSADSVTETILAKLFNIDRIVQGQAVYNTAQEGTTDVTAFIWTNCAWLAYSEKSPGLKKASAIYTLWKDDVGSPYVVKKWREEKIEADRIEVNAMFQHKPVATLCAYLIRGTAT